MRDLQVTTHESADAVAVVVGGELDLAGVEDLRHVLRRAEHAGKPILVDLRQLRFVDPAGMGPIVEAHRRAREQGAVFAILPAPWPVHKAFCMSGLDPELPFVRLCSEERHAEIAEDLRQGILQDLFAARLFAANVLASMETQAHTQARELAEAVVEQIGGAITELRAIAAGLA